MRVMPILCVALMPSVCSAEDLKGASLTWFVFSPTTAEIETSDFELDPRPAESAAFRISCKADRQSAKAGPVAGHCRITNASGDSWDEEFQCDRPDVLPMTLMPGGVATEACQGAITILGGTGRFAGLTGHGVLRQARLATLPDGRIIGLTMRLYDDS